MEEEMLEQGKEKKKVVVWPIIVIALLCSGFLITFLLCVITNTAFGMKLWPMILCTSCFTFTTVGFFSTEGNLEKVYGVCSVVSAACFVVQLALLF